MGALIEEVDPIRNGDGIERDCTNNAVAGLESLITIIGCVNSIVLGGSKNEEALNKEGMNAD
jgi:hypothetical protein